MNNLEGSLNSLTKLTKAHLKTLTLSSKLMFRVVLKRLNQAWLRFAMKKPKLYVFIVQLVMLAKVMYYLRKLQMQLLLVLM